MNIIKKEVIDALFSTSLNLSNNPDILDKGCIYTIGSAYSVVNNEYFKIKNIDSKSKDIAYFNDIYPIIYIDKKEFLKLNHITKVYTIIFCGFMYYKTSFFYLLFPSHVEREADKKTIKYLIEKGILNSYNSKELIESLNKIFYKYGFNNKINKRMRNIVNLIPIQYLH